MTRNIATAFRLPGRTGSQPAGSSAPRGVLGYCAAVGVLSSLVIMIGVTLVRDAWMPPYLPTPAAGPPWQADVFVPQADVVFALWVAGGLATVGVVAAMLALRRGEWVPLRMLIMTGLLAVAILTFLPPAGSTDPLDYAIYGHIAAAGHSPYTMTPLQYAAMFHAQGAGIPKAWDDVPSVYGPLATVEQLLAAKLAGASLATTTFYLKLVNSLVFGAVALAADRATRSDRAARARVHVLWTANPLMIWNVIAASHVDLLAAAVGVAGLLVADRWKSGSPLVRGLVAGLCIGAAIGIKADYLLFALALAWAWWRRPVQLLAAVAGAAVVLVPSYAVAGTAALKVLTTRAADATGYGFYGFYGWFLHHLGGNLDEAATVAAFFVIPVAILALIRLPAGYEAPSSVRAALALSLSWLLLWPDQFAWYSTMIICVLIFFPASRLDWLSIGWLAAITIADMPGRALTYHHVMGLLPEKVQIQLVQHWAPLVMLGAAVALVWMCINKEWRGPERPAPELASAPSS